MDLQNAISLIKNATLGLVLLFTFTGLQGQSTDLFGLPTKAAAKPQDFTIDLQLKSLDNENFQLVSTVDLVEGAYIISPFSTDEFYLNYTNTLVENNSIATASPLVEFPDSVEELDLYIERLVRFVRTKTVFTQAYQILDNEDFVVKGLIEFLVEPSCIPYDVHFEIRYQSGILTIENEKIVTSAEYKR